MTEYSIRIVTHHHTCGSQDVVLSMCTDYSELMKIKIQEHNDLYRHDFNIVAGNW